MNLLTFVLFGMFFGFLTYKIRYNFILFTFISVLIVSWFVFPIISYLSGYTNHHGKEYLSSKDIFIPAVVYTFSVFLPVYMMPYKSKITNYDSINFVHLRRAIFYSLIVGLGLKFISGSLFHSSVFQAPLYIPALFGIADKIYYLGIGFLMLGVLVSENKRDYIIILLMLILVFGFAGSRISILIPVLFLIFIGASNAGFKNFFMLLVLGSLSVFLIIILIGYYRISPEHRIFSMTAILNTVAFRAFDFQWPILLIQDINDGIVGQRPEMFFHNLTAFFPRLSNVLLGYSIFSIDTRIMLDLGYGNKYMSVPMTPIGEAFLFAGYYGLVIYGTLTGFILALIDRFVNSYKIYGFVISMEMFRSVLTLNNGTFADVISLATKDLILSVILFNIFLKLGRGSR